MTSSKKLVKMNPMNKTILYNPFQRFQTSTLIIAGTIGTIIFCILAYFFETRFDGAIDLHFVNGVEIYQPFIDNIVVIITLSILLFLAGKMVNRKTRFIDNLSVSLIARLPFYFLLFFNYNSSIYKLSHALLEGLSSTHPVADISNSKILLLLAFATTGLLLLAWYITLLYNGYRLSCNAKNNNAILYFVIALIGSEIISKLLIHSISL